MSDEGVKRLACRGRGLDDDCGRGFDKLPADVLARFDEALVGSFDPDDLRRALGSAVRLLLQEAGEAHDLAEKVERQLLELDG